MSAHQNTLFLLCRHICDFNIEVAGITEVRKTSIFVKKLKCILKKYLENTIYRAHAGSHLAQPYFRLIHVLQG